MRFMIIRKADAATEAGVEPPEALGRAMIAYHEEMSRALKVLGGDGLHPSSRGARVKFKAGKPMVVDGPFAETKELIAGYTLVEASSLDEVLAWAKRWPAFGLEADVELEVRQIYEHDELGLSEELQAKAAAVFRKE